MKNFASCHGVIDMKIIKHELIRAFESKNFKISLLLSMFLGILISIIQAATQIHEQTITFVPKLILIIALCLFSGNWMLETLQDYTFQLFQMMLL